MFAVIVIFILLLLNGLFAMSEIALVSSRKSRLEQKAKMGSSGAKTALKLLEQPEKFLSTVQIGITLVGIFAGAYGGDAFTEYLEPLVERVDFFKPYAQQISFTLIVIVITYFSLIIGELVPKSIAMNNPEGITIALSPFMRILSMITYPFVALLTLSTKLILKIFRIRESTEPPVTEEELKYLIDTGSMHGIIEKQEREIMYGVFRFGDRTAQSLMTRRNDIVWLDIHQSRAEILTVIQNNPFTKYPLCNGNLDETVGVISLREILTVEDDETFDLKAVMAEPIFIPSTLPALKILDLFKKRRIHIGIVVDEFGGVEGLITLHDLVENIMGEMPEADDQSLDIKKRDETSWLADGGIEIHQVRTTLGLSKFPGEGNYNTLAGFVFHQLHKIPVTGDYFEFANYKFEVIDMDGTRIDKVLIQKITATK